ncbi:50S ribosomal protein L1 [bacterium]|nr:50S ribosomal protein L1 [bacterium]
MKRGKKYLQKIENIDLQKTFSPKEAIKLVKELAYAEFDESLDLCFNLGIDPRHADQQVRGTLSLPYGTGKKLKIVVITSPEKVADAKEAGADEAGSEELVAKIAGGWFDFDLVIASPEMMPKIGKVGRFLGQKGLMPSPKNGTVTTDLVKTVQEFKKGKVEYRNDKGALVHMQIGKKSFAEDHLLENFNVVYDAVLKAKPSASKGVYFKSIVMSSSMGPGVHLEVVKDKW